jgi:uncharacterized protein YaiI (UPF0178 family)
VAVKMWIDADGCPRDCKEMVQRAAVRRGLELTFVANRPLHLGTKSAKITSVVVEAGLDVADAYLVKHAQPGDLVVTSDVPLAAELVEKGIEALSPRGELYTAANVRERLSLRDFFTEARESGVMQGTGPPPYDEKAKRQFANALDRWLTRATR